MIYAIIDKITREAEAFVYETAGYDSTLYDFVELPDDNPDTWFWDVATETFVPRPPSDAEETFNQLAADPRWAALRNATPAQVENWLENNVTDLASARIVLKFMLLALKVLAKNPRAGI